MTDTTTQKSIRVEPVTAGGALIDVSESQLPAVVQVLDAHQVQYWVHNQMMSINGSPYMALVQISRREDPRAVQALLDAA
jgi:hypothetical protein